MKTNNIYEDYDVYKEGKWLRSWNISTGVVGLRECHHTLSGIRWDQLSKRCKHGSVQQKRSASYVGTTNDFADFQEFVEWSRFEVGYNLKDSFGNKWSLDKDILAQSVGRKSYSTSTCLYIPQEVNMFLVSGKPSTLPLGVRFIESRGVYVSKIRVGGRQTYLGSFDCPSEAHRKWQSVKVDIGRSIADEYKWHTKLYEGLHNKMDNILKDLECGRETLL